MAKKGSAEERDLVHKLWERDFAAMRAPASGGATKKPLPDVVAGNGKLYLAIEVKTTTQDEILTLKFNFVKNITKDCMSIIEQKQKTKTDAHKKKTAEKNLPKTDQ